MDMYNFYLCLFGVVTLSFSISYLLSANWWLMIANGFMLLLSARSVMQVKAVECKISNITLEMKSNGKYIIEPIIYQ